MKDSKAKRNAPAGRRKKDPRRRAEERVSNRASEHSRAEEQIVESETMFRLCIENMLDGFAILSPVRGRAGEIEDFRYLHMNEAGCRVTEVSREEHLGSTLLALYPEAGPGGMVEAFARVAVTGESLSIDSWPYQGIFGGREVSRIFDVRAFRSEGNVAIVFRDVTGRKETEETLSRLASFPEVNPNPVVEVDTGGAVHYLNPAARSLFPDLEVAGLSHPWLVGMAPVLDRIRCGGDGSTATLGVSAGDRHYQQSIHYLEGRERYRIYSIDITARKRAEEALQTSLSEKEILLRELAHRTKNNMQVIVGLLDLHAAASKDGKIGAVLSDIRDRIRTMALVHENLYKTGEFASLSMRTYVQDLLDSLLRAHRKAEQSVTTCLDLDEIFVSIDAALPCGLIVTELVSNSLKHAFAGRDSGSIFLSLRKQGERTEMRYRDDGPGLPPGLDLSRVNTLGLKLIRNLAVHQLRGTMAVRQGPGTEFVFGFRDLDPGRRG